MDPSKIYAAALSSTNFAPRDFFCNPSVILRILSTLFSIIVFGAVSSGCRTSHYVCIFNGASTACSYAVGVGVCAFLGSIVFLVFEGKFNSISNIKRRRQVVVGDLAFSGLFTFLWFVGFCLLTNKWTNTAEKWLEEHKVENWQENNARAALVFSFFSVGIWAGITFFALQRFRIGQSTPGDAQAGQPPGGTLSSTGYTGIPGEQGGQLPQTQSSIASGGDQYYGPSY